MVDTFGHAKKDMSEFTSTVAHCNMLMMVNPEFSVMFVWRKANKIAHIIIHIIMQNFVCGLKHQTLWRLFSAHYILDRTIFYNKLSAFLKKNV